MERIIRYFAANKLLINLLLVIIFTSGIFSMIMIKQEAFPPTDLDTMKITVTYPGASPADVELNTVIPIEDQLKDIEGIDEYKSICLENMASIIVTLDENLENSQPVKDEIYRKISRSNISEIPDEVKDIIITDINPKLKAVYQVGISPKNSGETTDRELFEFVDVFEKYLLRVNGVSSIIKSGYRDREIHVNVNPGKMEKYYISLNDIVRSIKNRNIRSTGGTLQSIDKDQNIVTIGQFENPLDVGNVNIRSDFEQRRVIVKDIARIKDDFEKQDVRVRVNRDPSVFLKIRKKENADIVKTVASIEKFISENKDKFSSKFNIETITDESRFIKSLLGVVASNAIIGFLLVFIILMLFLDIKTSFWTALGIPISMMIAFTYMSQADISLNLLTLGAIITVLGMLVDHGIVISEVIYEKRRQGLDPLEATVSGVKSVAGPVTVTILTTIVAFLPMLSISGIMGKFIYVFPVVITITLIASFFEAMIILPSHLAHVKPPEKKKSDWFEPVANWYRRVLKKLLKFRYAVVVFFIVLFAGSIIVSSEAIKNFVLIYDNSAEEIFINMEAPRGSNLNKTEKLTADVEKEVFKLVPENIRVAVVSTIGTHTSSKIFSQGNREHLSEIKIVLIPATDRKTTALDLVEVLKKNINEKKYSSFDSILISEAKKGPVTGRPVDIKIVSNKDSQAQAIQKELETFLKKIPGVYNIDNDQKEGKEELKVNFNYTLLAEYGMTVASVAEAVRTAYEGNIATSIQTTTQKIEFRVQVDDRYQKSRHYLENLLIPNKNGRLIKLKEIAAISVREGKSMINHFNGDRVVTVNADVDTEITTSVKVNRKIRQHFRGLSTRYPGSFLIFGGEAEDTKESLGGLSMAFIMAIMFIYFILIILFRSFAQPLLIVFTIPFGLIGALLAFTAHGVPLSFMGFIGIIGLSGVVINDSVIMVEFINRVIKENDEDENIVENISAGAMKRFRPVVLTTVTTVAGLLPTVYGIGGDARTLVPVVMAMAYGLLFATFLTLVFIPCLYLVNNDVQQILYRVIKKTRMLAEGIITKLKKSRMQQS